VKARTAQAGFFRIRITLQSCTAGILLAVLPGVGLGQATGAAQRNQAPANPMPANLPQAGQSAPAAAGAKDEPSANMPRESDRRRAAKLFLEASKLFEKEQFEEALPKYELAAKLDPSNRNYGLAADLTRSHAVTALIQAAAKDRIRGEASAERIALEHALELDPRNIQVTEHLHELGDDALRGQASPRYEEGAETVGEGLTIHPTPGVKSFHLHADAFHLIQQVFKGYGLDATIDDSVRRSQVRLDIDDATFAQAMQILGMLTASFYIPIDTHRVLVARDTPENRKQYERMELETIYLPGLTPTEMTEVSTLAKNVFELQQATIDSSAGTITIRAPATTLTAFNATIRDLIDGHSQVMLEVELIQIGHTSDRNTGIQPPQSMSAFNVYSEEQSILNSNQALVQQIISSGLAAPGDTLAILGILLASGQVSNSILTSGVALFGGGLTASALAPGKLTANFALNSSDSKQLDHMQLRLGDGQAATIKSGTRYPIQTSSFSSLSPNLPNIPGLTGAGSSSTLSSLLGSLGSSVPNVPQVQYQDLGLTLKATPSVMRNDDVALSIDMKIDALAGSALNGNPILNNRAYNGVITLRQGESVVLVSELDRSESRAISGLPGVSEIPGLNNVTSKDKQKSNSTLLIIMTPHVVRGTQAAGQTPMMRVERSTATSTTR
jgi:Flp pilus assembly secretin CpaC/tetratricopeptide (TPR) repeat protein